MDELLKTASSKLIVWFLGVIASLLVAGIIGGFKFYTDWYADEAAEDAIKYQEKAVMFDSPEQKEEFKDHVKEALPALEQRLKVERDKDFQKAILNRLSHIDSINQLNAVQNDVIKNELKLLSK